MTGEFLTSAQLAERLQVSKRTLLRWRAEGLPYKKLGEKTFRYDTEEVTKWLTSRNQK